MVARSALAAVMVLSTFAAADPKPKPVDTKEYKDKLVILRDSDGGTYAVFNDKDTDAHVFYGTGKALYEQLLDGPRSFNGDAWSVATRAPRTEFPFQGHIEKLADGSFRRVCGDKLTNGLTELTGDKAKEVLTKYSFLTTQTFYAPHLLARDDRGIYYYVDVLRPVYGGNGYRVWVGKKGAMKQLALTDVASDTAGDVFSTKTGDLRLVKTVNKDGQEQKATAQWIRGEKRSELIMLDLYMNNPLIYRDLGLYKISETVCGNI
jgi:hypothetical protein